MGIKKTLTPIYGKNDEGQRIQTGHKLNGVFIPLGKPIEKFVGKAVGTIKISTEKPKETVSKFKFSKKKR